MNPQVQQLIEKVKTMRETIEKLLTECNNSYDSLATHAQIQILDTILADLRSLTALPEGVEEAAKLIQALMSGQKLYKDHTIAYPENYGSLEGCVEYLWKEGSRFYMDGWGSALGTVEQRIMSIVTTPEHWRIEGVQWQISQPAAPVKGMKWVSVSRKSELPENMGEKHWRIALSKKIITAGEAYGSACAGARVVEYLDESESPSQGADNLDWLAIFQAALKQLVDLKELKDTEGKTPDYEDRQPKAWHFAKEVLSLFSSQPPVVKKGEQDELWNHVISRVAAADFSTKVKPSDTAGLQSWKDGVMNELKQHYTIIKK